MVVRLSASLTGRLYPQKILLVFISVRGSVDPRAIVRSEGFYVNEKSNDTSWDQPATFRLVAQTLSHCATAVTSHTRGPGIIFGVWYLTEVGKRLRNPSTPSFPDCTFENFLSLGTVTVDMLQLAKPTVGMCRSENVFL
jgi:hypothetical protein